jgi:2-polyprenyl-3-methyl-5-hydroxy-6-metoxy-1,4-benzoquinol methylase
MIKEHIKKRIKMTGMYKSLEIENEKLKSQIKELKSNNENLTNQINNLKKEKQYVYSKRFELNLDTNNVRGVSTDSGKSSILNYILENVSKNAKILDVGFGSGIYCKMLRVFNYQNIDGIDVYDKNIVKMGLDKIYNNIYIKNILDFDFSHYDLIIMGDVLEHIELEAAKNMLSCFIEKNKCEHIVVSIPYEYEQNEIYGNTYEKHLQPEVNKEFMEKNYPYLELIDSAIMPHNGGIIATYVWNKKKEQLDND